MTRLAIVLAVMTAAASALADVAPMSEVCWRGDFPPPFCETERETYCEVRCVEWDENWQPPTTQCLALLPECDPPTRPCLKRARFCGEVVP